MSMSQFLGKKAAEVVAGEVVKKTTTQIISPKPQQEESILSPLKDLDKNFKEACDLLGVDSNVFKKKIAEKVKPTIQGFLGINKPKVIPVERKPQRLTMEDLETPTQTPEPTKPTNNKMKFDINKAVAGINLFLRFAEKEDLSVKEFKEFISREDNTEDLKALMSDEQIKGFGGFLNFVDERKTMKDLQLIIVEQKALLEGLMS